MLQNERRLRIFLVTASLTMAAALPLFVMVAGAPISHPDAETFARLHLHPAFATRVVLTFLYFPAVIALYFLIQPRAGLSKAAFLIGFSLFLLGNAIDATYRSIQFVTAHGRWATEMLASDPARAGAAAAKIATFNEIAPAVTAIFSFLFACGRLMMGAAVMTQRGWLAISCGAASALNGLWNLFTVLSMAPIFAGLASLGSFYMWIWLAALLLAGAYAWQVLVSAGDHS